MPGIILILIVLVMWACCTGISFGRKAFCNDKGSDGSDEQDQFYCTAEVTQSGLGTSIAESFTIKIRGYIVSPSDMHETDVQVLIADVTDGHDRARPILCTVKQWQMAESPAFCYKAYNGKLPNKVFRLLDWFSVVTVPADYLQFPRKGKRKVKFVTSIISCESEMAIACAQTTIKYVNHQPGYIDTKEKNSRIESLILQLADTCRPAGCKNKAGLIIREWITEKTGSGKGRFSLKKMFTGKVLSLEKLKRLNIESVCKVLVETATVLDRYNAIELCLRVTSAGNNVTLKQTTLLKRIAGLLGINSDKLTAMTQKSLPVNTHKTEDVEFFLGINDDMTGEQIRCLLNDGYKKWNGRVTHPDTSVRDQANEMLDIIARARNKHIESYKTCSSPV